MSLSAQDLEVLRMCALEDWSTADVQRAWADLCARVNEQAIRGKLYRLGLVDVGDRITLSGRVELWNADLGAAEILRRAS